MKRYFSFLLALIMLFILTACTGETVSDAPSPTSDAVTPAPSVSATSTPTETTVSLEPKGLDQFVGEWSGKISKSDDEAMLHIFNNNGEPEVFLSSDAHDLYYWPVGSSFSDNMLTLSMNDEQHRLIIVLDCSVPDNLTGTSTQYGETSEISLNCVSRTPSRPEYTELSYAERLQQLTEYENFEDDDVAIPFTYELGNRQPWLDVIEEHGLDALTEGKTDVELMKMLLFWVSDNFKHGNPEGSPSGTDAMSVIEFTKTTGDYTNCRGLSIILADLCRAYGIPAKHITCMPKERRFYDCHVVVLAYSSELNQWIMLDPTYKLVLQDENETYLDLRTFREYLISGEKTVPNEEFSYNGSRAVSINSYREYMTKNTFRFSSATDFYYGAEEGIDGNVQNMLIPVGYDEDSAERTTTSDKELWKVP